ncbi:M6 family metalloprotease domain-containing protein [candidate division KSB1 bacterium]|nr:M6 family metalloprotease domain-containing protein [candidate division KSB1 bacterium]
MNTPLRTIFLLSLLLPLCSIPLSAMPPHPDLLARIQSGEQPMPHYLQNEAALRARGIENPDRVRTLSDLMGPERDTNLPILAVLVDFSDNEASVAPSFFDNLLFGATGSLQDYYQEVTYGNLTLMTYDSPSTVLWVRAPQTYAYYVDGQQGEGTYPHNVQRLVEDVVAIIDPVVDFSVYDPNGDGDVDGFFLIHAGPGAEVTGSNDDIWSFAWTTENVPLVDGVWVYKFSTEPEYMQTPGDETFGVYAHEAGHAVFGLPDFYDTDYTSEGLGLWTLMAGGSWGGNSGDSPAHLDAWSKIHIGVVTPTNVTTPVIGAAIPAAESSPTVYRLWTGGATGDEYFLLENRQQIGYDQSLTATGLLIYHVDDAQTSNDNEWFPGHTSTGNYWVALEQADGYWDLETNYNDGDEGDPYPGTANNRDFSDASLPESGGYDAQPSGVVVTNISASGAIMYADLSVSGAGALANLVVDRVGANTRLSWRARLGAAEYRVYRSSTPDVAITPGNYIATTTTTEYLDPLGATVSAFYAVTAVTP